jgi:hypothetical protein
LPLGVRGPVECWELARFLEIQAGVMCFSCVLNSTGIEARSGGSQGKLLKEEGQKALLSWLFTVLWCRHKCRHGTLRACATYRKSVQLEKCH